MYDDAQLIAFLSTSSASLDRSPKKNWVEGAGQLPPYIRKLARAIEKTGKSLSAAIAIAISRCKAWAAGGDDVDADTRAKAAAAISQWEALKAKNKSGKLVKASREDDGSEYVLFSNIGSFNTRLVERAWSEIQNRKNRIAGGTTDIEPYSWVRELWTDFIIVEQDSPSSPKLMKIPYTVEGTEVSFGEPAEVVQKYVEVDEELDDAERKLLSDVLRMSSLEKVIALSRKQ